MFNFIEHLSEMNIMLNFEYGEINFNGINL